MAPKLNQLEKIRLAVHLLLSIFLFVSCLPVSKVFANDDANNKLTKPVFYKNWTVSAANPYAARAGNIILEKGGTAVDAMIAVQSVLGLVEPQSSGLGGGAFLLWFDNETKKITTLDGRETASRHVNSKLFLNEDGTPLKFFEAVIGGKSVGTPGVPALMLEAHKRWGKLPWSDLFETGIELAEKGFLVSDRLATLVFKNSKNLSKTKNSRNYFLPNGIPIKKEDLLKNIPYSKLLKSIAKEKSKVFYNGKIAADIVHTVQNAEINPGLLDEIDLAEYRVKERPPVCIRYRGFDICGMGPPSSGGIAIGQILIMLESFDLSSMGPNSPDAWRLIGDASRLAFADRGKYVADSDFVRVPTNDLLDKAYLKRRAKLLSQRNALPKVFPGVLPQFKRLSWSNDYSIEFPSTSHISIVDKYGNAVSMTTTIENTFGSRLMTDNGFLLNNQMTDFSFLSERKGSLVANRIQALKRPRSSMAPTIVLKDGELALVIGSPGGSRIIGYVLQSIISFIDWDMTAQEIVSYPRLLNRNGVFEIENTPVNRELSEKLSLFGYKIKQKKLNSGLHAIVKTENGLEGGADPRREGVVLGN